MQVFFIEQNLNSSFLKKRFKKIDNKEDKIFINVDLEKLNINKKIKLTENIIKIINKNNCNKIIIDKTLEKNKEFENLLYSYNLDIIKGKGLLKFLLEDWVKIICKKNRIDTKNSNIGITVNTYSSYIEKLVQKLSNEFKAVNIITNNIYRFKKLQEVYLEDNGLIITITNNKRKALLRTNIILNIDFPEELINEYTLNDYAVLINIEEFVKIKKKRFNGKIINEYQIKLKKDSEIAKEIEGNEIYSKYDLKAIVEYYIMNNPKEIDNIIIC